MIVKLNFIGPGDVSLLSPKYEWFCSRYDALDFHPIVKGQMRPE